MGALRERPERLHSRGGTSEGRCSCCPPADGTGLRDRGGDEEEGLVAGNTDDEAGLDAGGTDDEAGLDAGSADDEAGLDAGSADDEAGLDVGGMPSVVWFCALAGGMPSVVWFCTGGRWYIQLVSYWTPMDWCRPGGTGYRESLLLGAALGSVSVKEQV